MIPGDDNMVQNISPINKSGLQDIFSLWRKYNELKYSHNKPCILYCPQEAFYFGDKEHPSISVVVNIVKKKKEIEYSHQQHRARLTDRFYWEERRDKKKFIIQIA